MIEIFNSIFGNNPLTKKELARSYLCCPSISEKLPWVEYDSQNKCFLLDDGKSVGAVFELSDMPSESRPLSYLQQLQKGLQSIFQDVFPQYFDEESPWIVQFYVQDELSLKSFYQSVENYIKPAAKDSFFSQEYLRLFKNHLDFMTQKSGLFTDTKVSGSVFRGKIRKIRAVIYRRINNKSKFRKGRDAIDDLNTIAHAFSAKLESTGIKVKRVTGKEFYDWMIRWFNPAPNQANKNPDVLLENCPYSDEDNKLWGYDFTEKLFYSTPESDHEKGLWFFDEQPHKYLTILGLNSLPKIGHLSLERQFGNHFYALLDKLPEGSIFQMTVIIQNQEAVKNHLFRIEKSAHRATSMESQMALEDCAKAKRAIESGNYFFPTVMGVYLRGDNISDLYDKELETETLLSSNGLHTLHGDMELTPVDSYLHYLPMSYSYEFDKQRTLRSRYLSGIQLSHLLPLYGRERGTPHPAITLYNRAGEPLTLDPFNPHDKDFNSHLLLLGTTGSGKSALCVYLMMQLMAVYRPRLVIIDAGNSFGLLSDYFKECGLSVNRVEISFNNPVSLNPFSESQKMLEQLRAKGQLSVTEESLQEIEDELSGSTSESLVNKETENRDYMGEMLLAAQLMITGGEKQEEKQITREDRYWILKAVVMAAQNAESEKRDQMIAGDIINAFLKLAKELEAENKKSDQKIIQRLKKMASNLNLFCQDNLSFQYFNTEGKPWPEADITILEMGLFKDQGYEAQRALAFMGAMNKTISLAEKHQYDERFTVFFADECHVVTNNALTAVSVTKCAKMSRKIGLWLWFATQNVKDFPNDARKMLSMMEFWICLGMSEAELDEVERFKSLTEEERFLFRSVRKEAKKYVEGVILCNRFKGLFRNIPPRLSLALAMTEKDEKAERRKIMEEFKCSEVEAARRVAEKMTLK